MTNTISELFKKRGIKIDNEKNKLSRQRKINKKSEASLFTNTVDEKNILSIPIKEEYKIKTTDVSLSPRRRIYEEPLSENSNQIVENTLNQKLNTTAHNYTQTSTKKPNTTAHNQTQLHTKQLNTTAHNQTQLHTTLNTTAHNQTQPNQTQLHTTISDLKEYLFCLSGNKKKTVFGICNICIKNCSNIIDDVTYSSLSDMLGVRLTSIKTTLRRLEIERLINIHSARGGRGATIKIILQEILLKHYSNFITFSLETKHNQTQHNQTQLHTTLHTNAPSSSSSYLINNKTTTSEPLDHENFTHDVLKLEISEKLQNLGFTHERLKQCFDRGHYPKENAFELIQDSLCYIDFNLHHEKGEWKNKKIDNVLNYVMPQLNKAQIAKPQFYKSEKEIAQERMAKELSEKKERENKLSEEIFESLFEEWDKKLTTDEKRKIILEQEGETAVKYVLGWKRVLKEYYKQVYFHDELAAFLEVKK